MHPALRPSRKTRPRRHAPQQKWFAPKARDALGSTQVMGQLNEFVRAYRSSKELHARLRFAEEIILHVGPSLRPFIFSKCRPEAAEDILQETLVAIATKLDNCQGEADEQVWAWCYGIARHKMQDHFRAEQRRAAELLDAEEIRRVVEAGAAEEPVSPGDRRDFQDALELLEMVEPLCRELLWSRFVLGWDYKLMAREYNMTPDAVRMKVNRCLDRARKLLAKEK
jgi:RNA polymerase sigma factor (sigma-70 family)